LADHDVFEAAHQWALAARLARRHPALHIVQYDMGAGNRVLKLTDFDTDHLWVPEYVVHLPPPYGADLPAQVLWRGIESGKYTIEEAEKRAGIHPSAGELSHQAFSYSAMAAVLLDFVGSDPLEVQSGLYESQQWGSSAAEWWDALAEVIETHAYIKAPRSHTIRSMYDARFLCQYFRLHNEHFELTFDANDAMVYGPARNGGYPPPIGLHALAIDSGVPADVIPGLIERGARDREHPR